MNTYKNLIDLIQDFDNAMLVTKSDDKSLSARPMAVAEATDEGTLWFVTYRGTEKTEDIVRDAEVAVTMQDSRRFVSLSATCQIVEDREKLKSLWKETWNVWFPDGPEDPSIVLLKVDPNRGEYWDSSGLKGLRYLVKAGRAYLDGESIETETSMNASVNM